MKLLILNGPNLNLLGLREPDIYGRQNYAALVQFCENACREAGFDCEVFQSNHEGAIVDKIQQAYGVFDGIVINPAAYTHTSVAILDALKAVALPAAEVHISDVTKREAFRRQSFAGMACRYHFVGEGRDGYVHAMETLKRDIEGSLVILHGMRRSEWEACRAAGAVEEAPGGTATPTLGWHLESSRRMNRKTSSAANKLQLIVLIGLDVSIPSLLYSVSGGGNCCSLTNFLHM